MRRRLTPELMDDPGLDCAEHARALRGLARLNALARSDAILWPQVCAAARENGGRASLLDVATGSGDVPLRLAARARRAGLGLAISACDVSAAALAQAARRAAAEGAALDLWRHDAVRGAIPGRYDIVTCSLFLHHLDREAALMLLRHAAAATGGRLLVSDLRRDLAGLAAAWGASRLVTRSRVVRVDAVRSVLGAYTMEEAAELARGAGLRGARVRACWPRRMLLAWRRD
ncbi:MAG TPA: methyltransferase domain-containing protein [Phycisphaerales bacterium]|nr:methyltransferase domain-containing protein [Phycisphaerales bacterium]